MANPIIVERLHASGVKFGAMVNKNTALRVAFPFIYLGGALYFYSRMFRGASGKAGKRVGVTALPTGSGFNQVAGVDQAKVEVAELVDMLRSPQRYQKIGARLPSGLLLVGPPGTGKTLLARAVAAEAGVPFFFCSGSDFVEMFVGRGAARVRQLFKQAQKSSPSILFLDELDAIGKVGRSADARHQCTTS